MTTKRYGARDSSQRGRKQGGGRRNKVPSSRCRHPSTRAKRSKKD